MFSAYLVWVEAPRREAEMRHLLALIPPPAGAVHQETAVRVVPVWLQVQAVYNDPPASQGALKPYYDELMRTQGWSVVQFETGSESAWQFTTYRKGDYVATLEVPPEYTAAMNLNYHSFMLTLKWPSY
jgi:hypothetical protein